MMPLSFVRPEYLWLLLFLPLVWGLIYLNGRGRTTQRRWASVIVRTLLLLSLVGSLAGAQWVRPVKSLTTVFLLDSSDSVSANQRSAGEQYIAEALQSMQPGDKAAIVAFGDNALVERIPSDIKRLGAIQSVPIATRTDIGEALQLGLALFPADTQKRLVLLSDGAENIGRALNQLPLAQRRQVPIDIMALGEAVSGPELSVVDFRAPASARSGQEVQLVATVESNVAQNARLRWMADSQVLLEEAIQVPTGTSTYTATVVIGEQGFHQYQVQILPDGEDGRPQNNVAGGLIDVGGEPKILIVEGEAGDGTLVKNALLAANLVPVVVAPSGIPVDLAGMADYEAILLVNVPSKEIAPATQELIRSYVRDLGRGLAMIGGTRSFGTGGYTDTPIEEALPVTMDVRNKKERPDIALVFVIDKSGSMDACHCNGGDMGARQGSGTVKIDIAKEAVLEAATILTPNDKMGVVTFDDVAHWPIELQQIPSEDTIKNALGPVKPNGATNVVAGMQAALDQLKTSDAKIKHVILLTDGWGRADIRNIVQEMRENGITLTTVAAGNGSDESLEEYANIGGGRYYPARTMEEVPQIFLEETIQAVGTYIIEETFTPAYSGDTPILTELQNGLPQLFGYNGTVEKDTAQISLVSADGSPILAQWQYGLGRSVAWTSDMKSKWAANWVNWDQFPRFVAQLVGWILPRLSGDTVTGSASTVDTDTVITVNANDVDSTPLTGLLVTARATRGREDAIEMTFNEVGPGIYQGRLSSPIPGTYLVQVIGTDADGKPVFARTIGAVVPYSAEYRQGQANPQLLQTLAKASGGRELTTPAQAFDHTLASVRHALPIEMLLLVLAIIILLIDIAVRRLSLRWSDIAVLREQRMTKRKAAAAPGATLTSLQEAKGRARDRIGIPPSEPKRQQAQPTATEAAPPPPKVMPSQPLTPPPADDPTMDDIDPLERLKAAKNRARRR